MPKTTYLGRRAVSLENDDLRVTVTEEGGHIAEIFSKAAGINPLWTPNWTSGEPSAFGPADEAVFGTSVEAKLLFGILGHNLCLDLFGGPSAGEAAAGMTAHGESSVLPYTFAEDGNTLVCTAHFPLAQLDFERRITLHGTDVLIQETVRNLAAFDRPLAWTQHVTLSPPFLDPAHTQFHVAAAGPAMVHPVSLGEAPYLKPGEAFNWPDAPRLDGSGTISVRNMKPEAPASSYIAVTLQPQASWTAWSPKYRLAISYFWNAEDFPWLGIWEENRSRTHSPWNNQGVTRGMEFGASPFPESRRQMVERGRVLDTPGYRWIEGNATLKADYWVRTALTDSLPLTVATPTTA